MNFIFHFFFNFAVASLCFGPIEAKRAVIPIAIFSTIIDVDHVRYIIREWRGILKKRFGAKSRTIFHDFLGLAIFSWIFSIIFFLPYREFLFLEASILSVILHLAVDFLAGKAHPLQPFSFVETCFFAISARAKIILEISLTVVFGGVFLFLWQ